MIKVTTDLEHFSRSFNEGQMFLAGNSLGEIVKIFVFGLDAKDSVVSLFRAINFNAVDWSFKNCGGSDPLTVKKITLENQPSKGS
jgi:hypothetical protein